MKKRVLCLLLALTTSVSLCACGIPGVTGKITVTYGEEDSEVLEAAEAEAAGRKAVAYSDFSYEQYDPEHLEELIDTVLTKTAYESNAQTVMYLLTQIYAEETKMNLAYELAQLYSSQDVTSDEYADALTYSSDLLYEMEDKIDLMLQEVLSSPCRDSVLALFGESDVDYFDNYVEMTDEQQELYSQEQDLINQYYAEANADFTTTIDGKEYDQNDLYNDASLSEEEYNTGLEEIRKKENEVLGPIYVELVGVRSRLAQSYGYDNYAEYSYAEDYSREYTPEDALTLADYAKEYLQDPFNEIYDRYNSLASAALDEYFNDMAIDDQMALMRSWLGSIDGSLLSSYSFLEQNQLYDLEYSETKADTGFTTWLDGYEEPFLFNTPGYGFYDFVSLVHEFGHYNALYIDSSTEDCLDLAEVHSQGLEALFTGIYPQMFGKKTGKTAVDYTLAQLGSSVLDGCMYDEFQQQVYSLEDPTLDEINTVFHDIAVEYGYDYGDSTEAYEWVEISHNYDNPMYYISYALSALPALEIWETSRTDFDSACEQYMTLVEAGSADTYLNTVENCGLSDPFEEETIKALGETLADYNAE